MAEWDVVSQAPAPEFDDRWAPVAEEVVQDPWTPVQHTPVQPQGRGILQALKDYPEHFVKTLLETPQRAIEASEGLRTTGELSPEGAGDIMGGAMLGGVKFSKKVSGAKPSAAGEAASEWKPVGEVQASVTEPPAVPVTEALAPDLVSAPTQAAKALGSPMEMANEWAANPETVHGKLDALIGSIRETELALKKKYNVKKVEDLEDAPLTDAERHFLFYEEAPTSKESVRDISRQLQPVDSLAEAAQEIAYEFKRLPSDVSKMNSEQQLAVMRLQVLFHEVSRLGGDLQTVLRESAKKYGSRFNDPNDAQFMVQNAGESLKKLFEQRDVSPQQKQLAPPVEPVKPSVPKQEASVDPALARPEPTPQQMSSAQSAAKVIKNILIPDEVSPMAENAAADIRAAGGRAARDTETTRAALDAESRKVSALPDAEKLGLIDYIENRSKEGAPEVRADLKPVADAVKTAMDTRRAKLEALDSTEKARFVEDYYTHLWKDPEAAARAFNGPAKEGSGRFLKERSIPTVAEGIARGLEPVSIDPLETTMRYVQSMDRFIATEEVVNKALKDGSVKHYTPGEQPPGWVQVNTRRGAANPLYAPEDWARVYNNFVDRGIHANADWGKIYDGARNTSNAITTLELGLSGFHAATMAQEAMANAVARGIGEIASGKPVSALKSLIKAPIAPIADTLRGRKLEQTYLNKSKGTPLMQEITDLLTEAGGRGKGARHAPDYQYSQAGSYWDSFKRGSVMAEIKAAGRDIRERPVAAPIKLLASQVGRVMQTVAKPLFEYTIPKMKNGAFYENMASWMEANPSADHATQVKAARKIWDSIDNRFGEVVQDNIFWNKTLKQSLQVALRSYSWTFGTIQEIGGGAKDLLRHPTSLSPKSKHYSPKAAYIIALPITYATLNAVYQKLKTGKDPESIQDVMRGGLSGGTQPGVGGRGTVPERTMMPGYMKDVFGWYHHPVQEMANKIATAPRMVKESLTNKDWKDQPIRNPSAPYPEQVREYFKYVYQSLGPISVKQLLKGNKEGSNISTGETLLGLRPTPSFLQDPEGYEKMMKGIGQRDWQKKERYDKKQERQYGGP
jgi:hypothetical protein